MFFAIRGDIHTQIATRNVNLTFVGVWVSHCDVSTVAIWHKLAFLFERTPMYLAKSVKPSIRDLPLPDYRPAILKYSVLEIHETQLSQIRKKISVRAFYTESIFNGCSKTLEVVSHELAAFVQIFKVLPYFFALFQDSYLPYR